MTKTFNKDRALKVRELIEVLQKCDPEADVISTIWNGWTDTYCAIDRVSIFSYEELSNDFFGTPGQTDDKVFLSRAENVVALTSKFEYNQNLMQDKYGNLKEGLDYWHRDKGQREDDGGRCD